MTFATVHSGELTASALRYGALGFLCVVLVDILVAAVCAMVAQGKGHNAILFGLLSFFFNLITLIVVFLRFRRGAADSSPVGD